MSEKGFGDCASREMGMSLSVLVICKARPSLLKVSKRKAGADRYTYFPGDVRICYLRSKAITSPVFPAIYEAFLTALEHNLCLDCACKTMPERREYRCKTEA